MNAVSLNQLILTLYTLFEQGEQYHRMDEKKISEGGTSSTIIDQKIIFATALKCNASSIILSHNHPSGQLRASDEDRKMTERIVSIGHLIGIEVLDHVIVCRSGYYSMSDEGLM